MKEETETMSDNVWTTPPESETGPPVYPTDGFMFRPLSDDEAETFAAHAREHGPEKPDWRLYHPVCRRERGYRPAESEKNHA
jgi:hypothetical protein